MDDEIVCGKVEFIQMIGDKLSIEEKEETFKKAINNKHFLKLDRIYENGEILETTIYLKDGKLFIYRDDGYEDWFTETIYLYEYQLLELIN